MTKTAKENKHQDYFWAKDGIILLGILIIALLLRILPEQQTVFGSGWFNIQGNDAWYHVRLIENLVHHFPFRISFDPYTYYPYGQEVWFAPFYDLLIGFGAWVIGLGAPSQHIIEIVAAYTPPVLGMLTVIPAYFIGKTLFNRKVGLLAALLTGIIPSQFFVFSSLGKVDHHVAEVLFSTTALMFLIMALKQIKTNKVVFRDIVNKNWKLITKPLIYSLLCGIALGVYLLTWVGGLLFVFLFFCFFILMYIIDYLKHQNTDYLTILSIPLFLVPLLVIAPLLSQIAFSQLEVISLPAGAVTVPVLYGISRLIDSLKLKRYYFLVALMVTGVIAWAGLYFISPSLFHSIVYRFTTVFTPNTDALTIAEEQPFFFLNGKFTLTYLWDSFTTSGLLAIIAFLLVVITTVKKISSEKILLLVWFLIIFFATAGQYRFSAYLTVTFAILSAYVIWEIVNLIPPAWKWFKTPFGETRKGKKRRKQEIKPEGIWYRSTYITLAVIIIFFLGVYPNINPVLNAAKANLGMDRYWHSALIWMRENTPEPFGSSDFYYELYKKPELNQNYQYPASAYGVLSWWPFGHMITEVAHRIPNANPNQSGAASVASYLIGQNEQKANQMINKMGSKYVIIDVSMALPYNDIYMRFPDIAIWAGKDISQFADIYYRQVNGKWEPTIVYYPEYFYCMSTRLFNFDGNEVTPANSSMVISYKVVSGRKLIQSSQTFTTYEEAMDFINKHPSGNYKLVGTSPFISPVPLEKLGHYAKVYQSDAVMAVNQKVGYLKIFQYNP